MISIIVLLITKKIELTTNLGIILLVFFGYALIGFLEKLITSLTCPLDIVFNSPLLASICVLLIEIHLKILDM